MQMSYTLDRKGDKWVVEGHGASSGENPHGENAAGANPPRRQSWRRRRHCRNRAQALPPGHPPSEPKTMKTVAVLGGGPAGAFAAERLAAAGLKVVVFDEKLAWEKPCGGGLTYKAYREYPFLIDNDTPKKIVHETSLWPRPRPGEVQMDADASAGDLFAHGPEPHAAGARRAAGRDDREDARAGDRARATADGACDTQWASLEADFCIVATGARNPLREVGTEWSAEPTPCTRSAITLPSRRITSTFSSCRSWKATSGCFRAAGIFRWESAARANRRRRCARGWSATWTSAASRGRDRNVLQPHAAVARNAGVEKQSRGGRRLARGGRRGRAGGSDHGRRFVLRDALGRPGEPRGGGRRASAAGKGGGLPCSAARASSRLDLEFAATLAKRVFLGNFMFSSVPARMIQFMRRSPRFRDLMQDLFAGTQPYLTLEEPPAAQSERHAAGSADELFPATA